MEKKSETAWFRPLFVTAASIISCGGRFDGYLVQMIYDYIYYYNTQQVQRNLGVVTPMEKHRMAFAA